MSALEVGRHAPQAPLVARLLICLVVVAVAVAVVPVFPASAYSCAGDTWADGSGWGDNYYVSYACDMHGRYTVGIQRINWHEGYQNSTVDGYWGTNTYNDVRDFQDDHGEDNDGIVGPDTWDAYRSHITFSYEQGAFDYYKFVTSPQYVYFALDVVENPDRWYTVWYGWNRFDIYGP